MNKMNFLLATNAKLGPILPFVLSSIYDNQPAASVYLYYSALAEEDLKKISSVAKTFNGELNLIHFDIKQILDQQGLKDIPAWFGSYDAYTRIFAIQDLYEKGIDKCIYVDCDVMILKPLDELFSIYSRTDAIAGVLDVMPDTNKFKTPYYLNSGVMIFALDYCRKIKFPDKCVAFLKDYADQSGFMDQDAINNAIKDTVPICLDPKFNNLLRDFEHVENAVIMHYAGPKPWDFWRKWDHSKFVYYKLKLYYYLKSKGCNISKETLTRLFKVLEFVLHPLVLLLNWVHDVNFKRRMRRKARRNAKK